MAIVPPKFNLCKSDKGPSFAGENGKKLRILLTTPSIASLAFPIAPVIPSAIMPTIFAPASVNFENQPWIASQAPSITEPMAFFT